MRLYQQLVISTAQTVLKSITVSLILGIHFLPTVLQAGDSYRIRANAGTKLSTPPQVSGSLSAKASTETIRPRAPDYAVSIVPKTIEAISDFSVVQFEVVVKNRGAPATDSTALAYLSVYVDGKPVTLPASQPMPGPFSSGEERTFEVPGKFGLFTSDKVATCAAKRIRAELQFDPDANTSAEHPMDSNRSNDRATLNRQVILMK